MTGEMTVWMSTLRLVPRSFCGIGNMPHVVASSTLSPSHFLLNFFETGSTGLRGRFLPGGTRSRTMGGAFFKRPGRTVPAARA